MARKKAKRRRQKSIRKSASQNQRESGRVRKSEIDVPPKRYLAISFKYFSKPTDLSELKKRDLKDFTKFVKKISELERHEIQTDKGLGLESHKGDPASGYTYPKLSERVKFFEMRLNKKGRVHGFFSGDNVFCLMWIDPEHDAFPE